MEHMINELTRSIIAVHLNIDRAQVVDGARLKEDLGCDSLDRIEIAIQIEAEFNFEFDDDAEKRLNTVGEVIAYVHKKKGV